MMVDPLDPAVLAEGERLQAAARNSEGWPTTGIDLALWDQWQDDHVPALLAIARAYAERADPSDVERAGWDMAQRLAAEVERLSAEAGDTEYQDPEEISDEETNHLDYFDG
jgi:hypothetical protein